MSDERRLFWLRAEYKRDEARTPLVPAAAASLVEAGHEVVVESSTQRAIRIEDYVAAGCGTAEAGAWREAPARALVLGLKELDASLGPFRHRHVHFAHAFKHQSGWRETVDAFAAGGGVLFDLEYLVDEEGRRVAAFGYWAGFVGAALGLLALARQRAGEASPLGALEPWPDAAALTSTVSEALAASAPPADEQNRDAEHPGDESAADRGIVGEGVAVGNVAATDAGVVGTSPRVLIIGARGRSGRGARALCEACGVDATLWDIDETAAGGPFDAVREHELLLNCVFVGDPIPPFTTRGHLERDGRRLGVIVDVSCDPFGKANPLPLYEAPTTMAEPTVRLVQPVDEEPPLDLVAIDHLPSLLPLESSEDFSAQLLPALLDFEDEPAGVWARAAAAFEKALLEAGIDAGRDVSGLPPGLDAALVAGSVPTGGDVDDDGASGESDVIGTRT